MRRPHVPESALMRILSRPLTTFVFLGSGASYPTAILCPAPLDHRDTARWSSSSISGDACGMVAQKGRADLTGPQPVRSCWGATRKRSQAGTLDAQRAADALVAP